MTVDRELVNWVEERQEEMMELLRHFVHLDSPSFSKAQVDVLGAVLEKQLVSRGGTVRRYEQTDMGDHIVGSFSGTGSPILLCGHFDTVYAPDTSETWPLAVENGRISGPGALDMKAGIIMVLMAIQGLQELGRARPALRVVFNSDEEPGSPTSRHFWPEWSKDVRAAFVFEPTTPDGCLVTSRKGVGVWTLSVRGRAAHAGVEPEKGASAIRQIAQHVESVESLACAERGTTINVGVIRGGSFPYVVPEHAEAVLDIRVPDLDEQARVEQGLQELSSKPTIPGTETTLSGSFHRPPMEPLPGTESLIDLIRHAATSVGLEEPGFGRKGGASDANNLVSLGIPTIDGMGPTGGGTHSPDEYLDLESFVKKTALLAACLAALA